ncbi:hypothetical protein [Niveispirillum sp. KHB5.9]|uniref:hypothetical protein n=1 Tax=Niveispirillum sp. KHB5.9 TaxID=3400269 RepID=UPI003A869590
MKRHIFYFLTFVSSVFLAYEAAPPYPGATQVPPYPGAEDRIIYRNTKFGANLYVDRIEEKKDGLKVKSYVGQTNTSSDVNISFASCTNESIYCVFFDFDGMAVPAGEIQVGQTLKSGPVKLEVKSCLNFENKCRRFYIVSKCLAYNAEYKCSNAQHQEQNIIEIRSIHMVYDLEMGVLAFGYSSKFEDYDLNLIKEHEALTKNGFLSEGFR